MKNSSALILVGIVVLTIVGGLFIYPNNFTSISDFRPWHLGLDLVGGSHLVYEVDMSKVSSGDQESVLNGLRGVIERRVNLFGVSEPQVFTSVVGSSHRLIVELAGEKDTSAAIRNIGETPFLDFREVGVGTGAEQTTDLDRATTTLTFIPTELTGRYVQGAQLDFDQTTREPYVSISFDDEGAKLFEELTGKHIGEPLAIFLDNELITMPTVQAKISGGRAQITGNFTSDEAIKLVERFNAGALPAPITLITQTTIGPSLGSISLSQSIKAALWGTIVVILFMLFYYRFFGLFSSLALIIYIIFTLSAFKIIPITLTLSGIAGLILSIGIAVDANILIFERTKEELKKGLSKVSAIEEGFRRAWPSIRDSNITTIITSIILYYSTSGFVKGFGLALLIGVLVSMFSAITVTRTLLRTFVRNE